MYDTYARTHTQQNLASLQLSVYHTDMLSACLEQPRQNVNHSPNNSEGSFVTYTVAAAPYAENLDQGCQNKDTCLFCSSSCAAQETPAAPKAATQQQAESQKSKDVQFSSLCMQQAQCYRQEHLSIWVCCCLHAALDPQIISTFAA
jgi:hypothetical protein